MIKPTKKIIGALAILVCLSTVSCADKIDSLIEQAKFALDRCNPAVAETLANCTTAVEKADEIQTIEPANLDAAILESSGRLGLAGFDFLQLAARLADLQNVAEEDFAEFRSLVTDVEAENGREIDLSELAAAVTPLVDALTGVTADEANERAFFQLGIIQAIDAFIRPVKVAGEDAVDVADIDATAAATISDDFVSADDNLVTSGTTEDDILRPVRENFCRCSLNGGLTAACLRDLMRCELSDTATPEQDYNGDAATNRTDCLTLLEPGGLSDCGGTDTSL